MGCLAKKRKRFDKWGYVGFMDKAIEVGMESCRQRGIPENLLERNRTLTRERSIHAGLLLAHLGLLYGMGKGVLWSYASILAQKQKMFWKIPHECAQLGRESKSCPTHPLGWHF